MPNIAADDLRRLVGAIFETVGCSPGESARVARYLVEANLVGHDSHGVVRCERYVQYVQAGRVVPDQTIEVLFETDVLAVVDGRLGFGQTVGPQAVQVGIDKARTAGVAAVALRRAGHLGRIGDFAELAAEAGLVSLHLVNLASGPLVAPFGGVDRRMATNPVCIGVPRPGRNPLLLDFATSVVAEGKALVALKGGPSLPPGSLIGPAGELTDNPSVLYGDVAPGELADPRRGPGALRAMGEHKGSGLAFMCEVLAGALTGSGCAGPPGRHPVVNGMLSVYLDPRRFDVDSTFEAELADYVAYFTSARPAQEGGEVLVPGQPEQRRKQHRLAHGIDLPDDAWTSILDAARAAGVAEDRLAELVAAAR